MSIIGCDLHTRYQVVAWIDESTGEIKVRRLEHAGEEVRNFYGQLPRGTVVGWKRRFPRCGSSGCWVSAGTRCGWGTRRAFGPVRFASRRPTRAMPSFFWICCARGGFRASGCRR